MGHILINKKKMNLFMHTINLIFFFLYYQLEQKNNLEIKAKSVLGKKK
jgi:hypothetical protein